MSGLAPFPFPARVGQLTDLLVEPLVSVLQREKCRGRVRLVERSFFMVDTSTLTAGKAGQSISIGLLFALAMFDNEVELLQSFEPTSQLSLSVPKILQLGGNGSPLHPHGSMLR